MCGLKIGDRVVCVRMAEMPQMVGCEYTVAAVRQKDEVWGDRPPAFSACIQLNEVPWVEDERWGYAAANFRKVERKSDSLSIEAFLTIKPNQFEGPTRTNQPAKRKEQA